MKAQRAGLVTAAALIWGLIYASQFATTMGAESPGVVVKPTPSPTPCWEGCHIPGATNPPPKEPRLTMPPTDTE